VGVLVTYQNSELIQKLIAIEDKLQDHETDALELKSVVNELRAIVQSLDKDMAIQLEKQSHLVYRVEQLQREIELIEAEGVKSNDKRRAFVENAIMAVLGGLITYAFSLIGGK
jgi:chromosome segregation ATPase